MLDQLVIPKIRAIESSTGRIERAEIDLHKSMSDHANQLTELVKRRAPHMAAGM